VTVGSEFVICPGCGRHVRVAEAGAPGAEGGPTAADAHAPQDRAIEAVCPFCKSGLEGERPAPEKTGMSMGAKVAIGVAVAGVGVAAGVYRDNLDRLFFGASIQSLYGGSAPAEVQVRRVNPAPHHSVTNFASQATALDAPAAPDAGAPDAGAREEK
jgi:hypothetical protein